MQVLVESKRDAALVAGLGFQPMLVEGPWGSTVRQFVVEHARELVAYPGQLAHLRAPFVVEHARELVGPVVVAFDADDFGKRAADAVVDEIPQAVVLEYPSGLKGIDEVAVVQGTGAVLHLILRALGVTRH